MADTAAPDVGLVISGETFRFFTDVELVSSIDNFSTATFSAPFESDRKEFRRLFKPFEYRSVNALVDQKVRFTGSMLCPLPRIEPNAKSVDVACYSLPAVLEDCCPPATAYPLEFKGQTLLPIAQKIASLFGLKAKFDDSVSEDESDHAFQARKVKRGPRGGKGKRGNKFARVALEPGDSAKDFLVGLARQIGLVMADDEIGQLVFRDSDATLGSPVARFEEGKQPLVSITPQFNPQEYFSEVTAFTRPTTRRKGSKHTEYNPFTRGKNIVRPYCFKLDDLLSAGDAPAACWTKLGRMLGNCAAWQIDGIGTWRDQNGDLWKPNTTIIVNAPDAYIFKDYEFLIRDVSLRQDAGGYTASLRVVMPGAFSGAMPLTLPWDD